ncbi:MAG: Gfo/Idh/MocA family oxidoreductase [Thermofilaceae archaeon]
MKVAVIGVGRWGVNHVRVLNEIKKMGPEGLSIDELVVVDKDAGRAEKVARVYGASWTSDLTELLKMKVDAAIVAVPTVYHYDVAMKLLPHMDLLVEKPIAADLKEAEEMGKVAEREGRLLAVGHIERFNPVVMALKEQLMKEEDEIVHVSAQRIGPGPPSGYTLNLGAAHDLLIHDVDVVCYLLGATPEWVMARACWDKVSGLEVDISAFFSFDSINVAGDFRASWRSGSNFKRRILSVQLRDKLYEVDYILQTMTMEKGLVEHRSMGEYSQLVSAYTSKVRESWSLLGIKREPLLLEDMNFLQCVLRRDKPIVGWEDGYRALKCVTAALESARTGRAVRIK